MLENPFILFPFVCLLLCDSDGNKWIQNESWEFVTKVEIIDLDERWFLFNDSVLRIFKFFYLKDLADHCFFKYLDTDASAFSKFGRNSEIVVLDLIK